MPKKVLFVLAPFQFADYEYQIPLKIMNESGIKTAAASVSRSIASGINGMTVKPDLSFKDALTEEFDAVAVIGGYDLDKTLYPDAELQELLIKTSRSGKVVAAICGGSGVLANAGILRKRNATCYASETLIDVLKTGGATYANTDKPLEIPLALADGNILTANGPHASEAFGKKLAEMLLSQGF